jgi:hypothetical protein
MKTQHRCPARNHLEAIFKPVRQYFVVGDKLLAMHNVTGLRGTEGYVGSALKGK